MEKFYKTLLETANVTDKGIIVSDDTFSKVFKKMGYFEYDLGGETIFSSHELTQEEYDKYKKEYDDALNEAVERLAKDINMEIIDKLLKEHPEYDRKGITGESR